MNPLQLTDAETEELFVVLKPVEQHLAAPLADLLARIEKRLYSRLTIEEMEHIVLRSTAKSRSP